MNRKVIQGLLFVIIFGSVLRFYRLDQLPAEIYGDIEIVFSSIKSVILGHGLPIFSLSIGPVYFQIAAFVVKLFGNTYFVLKTVSVLIGVCTIVATYFFALSISEDWRVALLSAIFLSISKWHLIFSRIGHQIVIVAFFSSLSYLLVAIFLKKRKILYLLLTIVCSGLSLYTYIPAWIIPVSLVITMIWFMINHKFKFRHIVWYVFTYLILFFILTIPLLRQLETDKVNFFKDGYIGSKFFSTTEGGQQKMAIFTQNIIKSLLMFHVRGDSTFRSNPPLEPQLDSITGLMFLIGIVFILIRKKSLIPMTIVPILLLILPAALVVSHPSEVPSAARTVAVIPFVMVVSGIGAVSIYQLLRRKLSTWIAAGIFTLYISLSCYFNFTSYFFKYPNNLPHRNNGFGRIIAHSIDNQPDDVLVYIDGCCWGEGGEPEPSGIMYALKKERRLHFYSAHDNPGSFVCDDQFIGSQMTKRKLLFIVSPRLLDEFQKIKECIPSGHEQVLTVHEYEIDWMYRVNY